MYHVIKVFFPIFVKDVAHTHCVVCVGVCIAEGSGHNHVGLHNLVGVKDDESLESKLVNSHSLESVSEEVQSQTDPLVADSVGDVGMEDRKLRF